MLTYDGYPGYPIFNQSWYPFYYMLYYSYCCSPPQLPFQCCREAAEEMIQRAQALQHLQYWGAEASPGQLLVWMRSQHPSSDLPPLDAVSTLAPIGLMKYMYFKHFYRVFTLWQVSPPQFSLQEFAHLGAYERSLRPPTGFPPPTVYSDPPHPCQAGRGGGHPGGQPPAMRDLPIVIKQEPVEEVESAPGVSNTFPMVLPIFKPGTLLESVYTVQYHIF